MSVPNQKIIRVHKDNSQRPPFISLNVDTMKETYKYLGNAYTFYLYLCLCANADNYQFEFSPQQIEQQFGLPYNTVRDNIKRLIDKGFLVPIKEGSNIYDFYGELCACHPIIPQKKSTIPFKF